MNYYYYYYYCYYYYYYHNPHDRIIINDVALLVSSRLPLLRASIKVENQISLPAPPSLLSPFFSISPLFLSLWASNKWFWTGWQHRLKLSEELSFFCPELRLQQMQNASFESKRCLWNQSDDDDDDDDDDDVVWWWFT